MAVWMQHTVAEMRKAYALHINEDAISKGNQSRRQQESQKSDSKKKLARERCSVPDKKMQRYAGGNHAHE